jgi:hypothetical protein
MRVYSKSRKFVVGSLLAAAGIGAVGSLIALHSGAVISDAAAQPVAKEKPGAASARSARESEISFPPISSQLPPDITGGAGNATLTSAAIFAWQEFIALNWPAANQTGVSGSNTRGTPNTSQRFGADSSGSGQANQPVVWETYRGKVETFPGVGDPPGYANGPSQDYGFDVGPQYVYGPRSTTPPTPPGGSTPQGALQNNPGGSPVSVPACPLQQSGGTPPYVNLDEITQIGLDSMFAGVLPPTVTNPTAQNANAQPQLIRFLAKGNRSFYDYVAANQYWYHGSAYNTAKSNFSTAAAANQYPPPAPTINLPAGTVLVKAAWRPLAPGETASGFHTKTVRFYDVNGSSATPCYREQTWALIALHIIQKTPTAPDFIYATFEYTNNILTANGKPVEDNNGAVVNAPPGDPMDPRLNYFDASYNGGPTKYYSPNYPKGIAVPVPNPPPPSPPPGVALPLVQVTGPYCGVAGNDRLYFQDLKLKGGSIPPANSGVCVDKRYFPIPVQIQQVNAAAHAALTSYGAPPLWQNYKLVNVQWQPFDISTIDTSGHNTNRLASTFSLANSVVETDNTLQQFFGGLFGGPPGGDGFYKSFFEINSSGVLTGPAFNIYGPPSGSVPPTQFTRTNMGGCMGCHGRTERGGTDFSFTLSGGPVAAPEFAVPANAKALFTSNTGGFRLGFDQERLQELHNALSGR